MYGAGLLESQNIREYELAARWAHVAGCSDLVEDLLLMADVEWDHEQWFRAKAASHRLWHLVPHWPEPPPRAAIRESFAAFLTSGNTRLDAVQVPWLVR